MKPSHRSALGTIVLSLLCTQLAAIGTPAGLYAQVMIPPDTITTIVDGDTIPGFGAVGGVTVDALGYVYTSNFRNAVWRYTPGESIERLANGMFGASGNAIGLHGELYQSSFYGHYITRVARDGSTSVFSDKDLNGPVGIILGVDTSLYVVNCSGNYVSRLDASGKATRIAEGPLFACPNGITTDSTGDLYVVNFSNTQIIKVARDGKTSVFADIPGAGGNGHITYGRGAFFVTKFRGHQVFRVESDGSWTVLAGTGKRGHTDGPAKAAELSSPNGIMMAPNGRELWVNELISGDGVGGGPAHSILRRITLVGLTEVLAAAAPNSAAMSAAYRGYRAARPKESTSAEAIAFAYSLLNSQRATDAVLLFQMNAVDFASDVSSLFHLGEGYRFTRQPDLAKAQYRKVLAIDPGHAQAKGRLASLGG